MDSRTNDTTRHVRCHAVGFRLKCAAVRPTHDRLRYDPQRSTLVVEGDAGIVVVPLSSAKPGCDVGRLEDSLEQEQLTTGRHVRSKRVLGRLWGPSPVAAPGASTWLW